MRRITEIRVTFSNFTEIEVPKTRTFGLVRRTVGEGQRRGELAILESFYNDMTELLSEIEEILDA